MNAGGDLISGNIRRGLLLKEQGRYGEAERYFLEALGQDPRDAMAFHHLAGCQLQQAGRDRDALATIDQAIAIEPSEAAHHALKAYILCSLRRAPEALQVAQDAVRMAPDSSFGFTAEAQAFLLLEKWHDAELAARRGLALDADNSAAANQLAQALRLQNKMAENARQITGMLARDPQNPHTHASAGWAALQRGERKVAEEHFLEALRLDPEFDGAREGLLQSFRARSPLYRAYLSYCFAMQRLSGRSRWAVVLGLYFGVRFSRALFTGRFAPVGIGISIIYALFVLWVWVARGVGNFILLFDRFARHALRRAEKIEAVFVGGGLVFGIFFASLSMMLGKEWMLYLGLASCASIFPFSLTFTNASKAGQWLFGLIGTFTLAAGLASALGAAGYAPRELTAALFTGALFAAILTTWLGNIPFLRAR